MRAEKKFIIAEVEAHLKKSDYVILTNFTKITVADVAELRSRLAPEKAEFHVVKNSSFRVAAKALGLPEVEDLPGHVMQDPTWARSGGTDPGRDGCRVPLPWTAADPTFGFNSTGVEGWLPQPSWFGRYAASVQEDGPASMLALYRRVMAARRGEAVLGDGSMRWLEQPGADVLAFERGSDFVCVVNFGTDAVVLPAHSAVVTSSIPLEDDGRLPGEAAVWLRR